MIKALQFISNEKQSYDDNYLLVGDNDFLYLFIKDQIIKKSQKKDETLVFDCSDEFYESGRDKVVRATEAYELFFKTDGFDPSQFFLTKTL